MPDAVSDAVRDDVNHGDLIEQMMGEGLIGITEGAKYYGTFRGGKQTSPSTLVRHHNHGVKLDDDSVVRLQCIKIAGRLMTTKQAIARFIRAQNQPVGGAPADQQKPTIPHRRGKAAAAAAELDAMLS
jgi:hypothetical protein